MYGNMDKDEINNHFEINIENEEILYAIYDQDGYEGCCEVLFKNNNNLYMVNAWHCSCHGLEGKWLPEECSVEFLIHYIIKGDNLLSKNKEFILKKVLQDYINYFSCVLCNEFIAALPKPKILENIPDNDMSKVLCDICIERYGKFWGYPIKEIE